MGREINILEELNVTKAELNEFKRVISFFLGKYISDIDNITPEDLEYWLLQLEKQQWEGIEEQELHAKWWAEIYQLYLIFTSQERIQGYTPLQNVKIFIKNLVRDNYTLKSKNK